MDSLPSTDNEKEERQVRFARLNWSEEEERSNTGAQRRKQARDRRIALQKEQQEQKQEEYKARLRAIMEQEKDVHAFLVSIVKDNNVKAFEREFGWSVLRLIIEMYPVEAKGKHWIELISVLLEKWENFVQNDDCVILVKLWIAANESADTVAAALPPRSQPALGQRGLGQQLNELSGNVNNEPSDGDVYSCSVESDDEKVKNHFKMVLMHASILRVIGLYGLSLSNNAITTITMFVVLLGGNWSAENLCNEDLKVSIAFSEDWMQKHRKENVEVVEILKDVLYEVLARDRKHSVDEAVKSTTVD